MKKPLNIAFAQITSSDDVEKNLSLILNMLDEAPASADLYCFPENTLFFRINKNQKMQALTSKSDAVKALETYASESSRRILIGGTPFEKNGKVYNSTLYFQPDKPVEEVYSKIHLFDVDVQGEKPVRESDEFAPGEAPKILELGGFKLGLSICYDIRFSELYRYYSSHEVDVLMVPAAFLPTTGAAHWEFLLRARAIESQCYLVASAQSGVHRSSDKVRSTYGHSLAVGPWGEVLVNLKDLSNCWGELFIEEEHLKKVRAQIPMAQHRKDLF